MKRLVVCACAAGCVAAAGALEILAQVDHWDFSGKFDVETADGIHDIVDHVVGTGAHTLLWRVNGGSSPRYRSREEARPFMDPPLDLRRIPDGRTVQGHIRLFGGPGVDAYATGMAECASRGLGKCAYWPFEENHHFTSKLGAWNLEHPQFWTRASNGRPFMGRCSLAFPEVRAHKLRLLDEILAYGCDSIYIELYRTGGWTVKDEYVRPNLDAWAARYPGEPVPASEDPRWIALVGEAQHAFFKEVREHLDATGRKVRFLFGIYGIGKGADPNWTKKAVDWKRLVREKVVDGIVVCSVVADWERPLDSTREIYQRVRREIGDTPMFCPVSAYSFQKHGIGDYAKALGITKEAATEKLIGLARDVDAAGILLECVDYNNYTPEMMKVIREAGAKSLDGGKTWKRIDDRFPAEWGAKLRRRRVAAAIAKIMASSAPGMARHVARRTSHVGPGMARHVARRTSHVGPRGMARLVARRSSHVGPRARPAPL